MKRPPHWWSEGASLYLITDRGSTRGRALVDVVESALAGGTRLVQLREKDLGGRALTELARTLGAMIHYFGARLLVNGRADVALAAGADGVHLGASTISVRDARSILGPDAIVGVSTHSIDEAIAAEYAGADFITTGPVYHTASKAGYGPPAGVEILSRVSTAVRIPVYALGGVDATKVSEVIEAGANGVAIISAVMGAPDPASSTAELIRLAAEKRHRL